MKVGIIGAGYVGLTSAYRLAKKGHDVTVIEVADDVGGLARGFKDKKWDWTLEEHYHHWFTNDDHILSLAKEIGCEVNTYRPKTSILHKGDIYQFDSPISLLKFPHLSIVDKVRTAALMVFLKVIPFWKYFESVTTKDFLIKWGGRSAWDILWGPLMKGKFGKHASKIPMVWFWARIKKRTSSLAYPEGGFQNFVEKLSMNVKESGGEIILNSPVTKIEKSNSQIVVTSGRKKHKFDKVICTLPTPVFAKIAKGLSQSYQKKLTPLKGLSAATLVLTLKEEFFKDDTYWLNINESGYPFLAVVEHTNFEGKKRYAGDHILYVGNYLPSDHKYMKMNANQLLNEFVPALKKINPNLKKSQVKKAYVFKAPFAQPIIPMNYSDKVPEAKTSIDGLYLANMQQVYPWDRGTNYAVELGEKIAKLVNGV